jgi:hypothetical protein
LNGATLSITNYNQDSNHKQKNSRNEIGTYRFCDALNVVTNDLAMAFPTNLTQSKTPASIRHYEEWRLRNNTGHKEQKREENQRTAFETPQ